MCKLLISTVMSQWSKYVIKSPMLKDHYVLRKIKKDHYVVSIENSGNQWVTLSPHNIVNLNFKERKI